MSTNEQVNKPAQVLFASLVGTTVEFFDFYIFATAAVLVFPRLFFPAKDPNVATIASFAAFGVAFLARPVGSALFGHFGDRIGRKKTLVLALGTMGLSTFAIGTLPGYPQIGIWAPLLLTLCRFGQGIGLGGEWGGAVLLAVENAPPGKRAVYGMFPQFGAPIGFLFSSGLFLLLTKSLKDARLMAWGWRLPFLASALLVLLGLYVRLTIHETPVFKAALERAGAVRLPIGDVFARHRRKMVAGVLVCMATFVLFYLMTVFALSWGTTSLHYAKTTFLEIQMLGMVCFAITIPISALLAERGRRRVMVIVTMGIAAYGLVFAPMLQAGLGGATACLCIGLALMGLTYGPLGTIVSELFPTGVRYTGSSFAFSMGGVLGAAPAPNIAQWLATHMGLHWVGYYLSAAAMISLVGLLMAGETRDLDLGL